MAVLTSVFHVADGLAALELFARCAPDLVILDWVLPKLDGLEVLRRIREAEPLCRFPEPKTQYPQTTR